MPNFPNTIKVIPYSQRPTFLGVAWTKPLNIDVDRYELFLSPKSIGNNEVGALLMGAKEKEGVVKVTLPPGCTCVLDNRSPQGQRVYYTVFAVDKTGDFHQANFQVNDSANLALENPTYLKEPFTPMSLKFIPYGQRPDGIGISWEAPKGDWASYRVVVVTGKSISQPQDFEKLFAGQLDFAKLYEVPAEAREAIDDASPQGSRNYYSVVAVDRKGNITAIEKFQTVEGSRAQFKAPVRLTGKGPATVSPTMPPQGKGTMASPAPPAQPAPPCDQPRAKPAVPQPASVSKYPSRLTTIPSTQHIYGTRIRIKESRPDLAVRVVVATKSLNNPADALEGRLEYARVLEVPSGHNELIDNITEPYARCYYAVLGRDAAGNHTELPFEVKQPDDFKVGGARFLDPSRRWPLPTVDGDWLLMTTEKGIALVPEPSYGRAGQNVGVSVKQPWEGSRIRVKGARKEYVRYQFLIAPKYIQKDKLVDAAQGRSDYIKAYDIPTDATELIDNLTQTDALGYQAMLGWDSEGNAYSVELEYPGTQHAEFKSPRFVDPTDIARVKAVADELIALGRKTLAGIGTDRQALYTGGPNAIQTAIQCGARARLVYPMYEDIDRFRHEVIDRNGWLVQARSQFEADEALAKADMALKGDRQPYAFPNYSSAEESIKTVRKVQDESRAVLKQHIADAPWSSGSEWYKERLMQFDGNETCLKRLEEHMVELKARDAKAKALYEKARAAHSGERFDEAIELYKEVIKVKPEWDTNDDIQRAKDDKEYAGQIAAAGTTLSKFKAIYDDWMGREKSDYAWRALGTAFARLQDKDSFLLYERQLMAQGHNRDAVELYRNVHGSKPELLERFFGKDRVLGIGNQMEEAYSEMGRIEGEIRDLEQAKSELEQETFKIMGQGYTDYRTRVQNDIDRHKNAIERDHERIGDLYRRMAEALGALLTDA